MMASGRSGGVGSDLLGQALRLADNAMAWPELLRLRLIPDAAMTIRDDDFALVSAELHSLGEQLGRALELTGAIDPSRITAVLQGDRRLLVLLLARAVEWRMARGASAIGLVSPELSALVEQQIGASDPDLAEAAMAVLVSQSRFSSACLSYRFEISELPPEDLSRLVWRLVSNLQRHIAFEPVQLRALAEKMLGEFDEREGRQHRLARLCHLLDLPIGAMPWKLAELGPGLAFEILAMASGLPANQLFVMTLEPGLARLATVLRSLEIEPSLALGLLADIAESLSLPVDSLPSVADYRSIGLGDARSVVARWRNLDALAGEGLDYPENLGPVR